MDLVTVAEFPSRREAEESGRVLRDAEVPAVVEEAGERFLLLVAPDLAHVAIQLLRRQDRLVEPVPVTSRTCPECGAHETRELPPYALMWVVFAIILLGMLVVKGYQAAALVGFVVAWLVALWLSRFTGKRRCSNCGWLFSPRH